MGRFILWIRREHKKCAVGCRSEHIYRLNELYYDYITILILRPFATKLYCILMTQYTHLWTMHDVTYHVYAWCESLRKRVLMPRQCSIYISSLKARILVQSHSNEMVNKNVHAVFMWCEQTCRVNYFGSISWQFRIG